MRKGSDDPPPIAASEDWANEGAPSLTASEREAHLRAVSDACCGDDASDEAPTTTLNLRGCPDANAAIDRLLARCRPRLPRLRALNLEFALRVTDDRVAALARCGTLRRVNLNAAQHLGDAALDALSENNPHLERVSLYWNVRVTDPAIVALCARCANLERLDVSGCKRLTDGCAAAIASLSNLRRLNLTRCRLTDDGLRAICLSPSVVSTLEHLNLYAAPCVTSKSLRCVAACDRLTFLDLCGAARLDDDALRDVAEGCLNVRSLNLSWCPNVTDRGLLAVAKRLGATLELLSVHGNRNVTAVFLEALGAEAASAGRLKTLDARGCDAATSAGGERLTTPEALRKIVPSIETFVHHT